MASLDLNSKPNQSAQSKNIKVNRRKTPVVLIAVLAALAVGAGLFLTFYIRDKRNTIDLESCILRPVFEGYDGDGVIKEVRMDRAALVNKVHEIRGEENDIDYDDLISRIDLDFDVNADTLRNGDTVVITLSYDKSNLKTAFGFNFTGAEKEFTVDSLTPYAETDPFEGLVFLFTGTAPIAHYDGVELSHSNFARYTEGYLVRVNGEIIDGSKTKIDIGDVMSIELTDKGEDKMKEMGMVPTVTTATHTVDASDVGRFVTDSAEILDDVFRRIVDQARDECTVYNSKNSRKEESRSVPELEESYFLVPKTDRWSNDRYPFVILFFRTEVTVTKEETVDDEVQVTTEKSTEYLAVQSPALFFRKTEDGAEEAGGVQALLDEKYKVLKRTDNKEDLYQAYIEQSIADYQTEKMKERA